jgi:hypothetical protein
MPVLWAALAKLVVSIASVLASAFLIARASLAKVRERLYRRSRAARDEQLRAALEAPKTRDELVEKVRREGL